MFLQVSNSKRQMHLRIRSIPVMLCQRFQHHQKQRNSTNRKCTHFSRGVHYKTIAHFRFADNPLCITIWYAPWNGS